METFVDNSMAREQQQNSALLFQRTTIPVKPKRSSIIALFHHLYSEPQSSSPTESPRQTSTTLQPQTKSTQDLHPLLPTDEQLL
jgi:hypothetical protein